MSDFPDDFGSHELDATLGVGLTCDLCGDPLTVHRCEHSGCDELADCDEDYCWEHNPDNEENDEGDET